MRQPVASDAQLWARSISGDGAAFGALFDLHRDRVFRHAYRLVENRRDADDVTATAFLELWRRRADVRLVEASVLPWLLVTATNAARNVRRSAARYQRLLDSLPRTLAASDAESAFLAAHPLEQVDHRLATALRSLPAADMRLVSLVVLEGYPIAEAATVLGCSTSAAKTRLHRARTRLRATLHAAPESTARPTEEGSTA
ncbi:MAG TPA: RNA polymerase sigma factor [Microbacteriaceae bacterium]